MPQVLRDQLLQDFFEIDIVITYLRH